MMKNKKGLSFSISDRDKNLLLLLVALGILFGAYFLGYQNFNEKTEQYNQETVKLRAKFNDLLAKKNKEEDYRNESLTYKNTYNAVLAKYSSSTNQDGIIDFLSKVESITGSWLKSTTFTESDDIFDFGRITSTNPGNTGNKVYNTDMIGYKTTLTLSYEAKYDQWKSLLSFINNYYSKLTIDTISMSYNSTTDNVAGSMTLSLYAITGTQRAFTPPVFNLPTKTDNIFASKVFDSSAIGNVDDNGAYILSNYDYYLLLNSSTSSIDSCVMGRKDDTTQESVISTNSNDIENVTVRFAGSNGQYTVQYKVGNITYPAANYASGQNFVPGTTLDLLVMSSARLSDNDKSGVSLSVVNDTDMMLNIKVSNDDINNPRFKIASKSGDVSIY